MNFFEGRLIDEGGKLLFDEGSGKLAIPAKAAAALRARSGAEVVLGLRPETIAPAAVARFVDPAALTMKVWLVQPLGAQMDVYLSTARHPRIVAHTESAASPVVDETIPVAIDMSRAHFFEPGDVGATIA